MGLGAATAGTDTDARRAALAELFDHAALFPPAAMPMPDALREDRRVRAGAAAWLVRRFVCPLTRLEEVGAEQVRLSVVLDAEADERLADPRVEAVEVPPGREAPDVPDRLEVYVERRLEELTWLDETAAARRRAKVRCGGATVPSVVLLAAFVRRCRELGVAFKATAGLHHPVRGEHEHGFLNLLAAAVFGDEEEALAERDPAAFGLDGRAFSWRGRSAAGPELARVRRELFVGIGSCSIQEPVDDLRALGLGAF
jgi:hypothetical protein